MAGLGVWDDAMGLSERGDSGTSSSSHMSRLMSLGTPPQMLPGSVAMGGPLYHDFPQGVPIKPDCRGLAAK